MVILISPIGRPTSIFITVTLFKDEEGNEISLSNIGFSGGLTISYIKDGKTYKSDTSQPEKLCIIDGKRFVATEARFGGIVIESEK